MKKATYFVLVLVFVFSIFCHTTALAEELLTLSVPQVEAKAGELVEVPIVVTNNPGIISVKVELSYNTALLTLNNAQGDAFKGVSFGPLTNPSFTINWMDALHGNNFTNGVLATLTFLVKETAPGGTIPLTLTVSGKDVFDNDFNPVAYTLENGAVQVKGEELPPEENVTPTNTPTDISTNTDVSLLGDLNSDGVINAKDALVVLKISVGKLTPTWAEKILGDVNKDAAINAKDALEILKYTVGKPSCLA